MMIIPQYTHDSIKSSPCWSSGLRRTFAKYFAPRWAASPATLALSLRLIGIAALALTTHAKMDSDKFGEEAGDQTVA